MATKKAAAKTAEKETTKKAAAAEKETKTAAKTTKTAAKTATKAATTTTKAAAAKEEKKAPAKKAAAKKAAPAKKAPAKKATAKKAAEAKVNFFVEFGGVQVSVDDVVNNVKATIGKDAKEIAVYLKPEESKAYFVADGEEMEMDVFFC